MKKTPSQILNELHRIHRTHLGTVERFEPTEIDKLSRGLFRDFCAAIAVLLFYVALFMFFLA